MDTAQVQGIFDKAQAELDDEQTRTPNTVGDFTDDEERRFWKMSYEAALRRGDGNATAAVLEADTGLRALRSRDPGQCADADTDADASR